MFDFVDNICDVVENKILLMYVIERVFMIKFNVDFKVVRMFRRVGVDLVIKSNDEFNVKEVVKYLFILNVMSEKMVLLIE